MLATPVVAWCGRPFFERGWASIVNRSPNMWTLISIGVLAAYAYSVIAVLAPGIFPHDFHMHGRGVGRYFEAAAVIIVLVLLGQVLELRAREKTGNAIRALLNLAPKTARRIAADGSESEVPLDTVQVGDRLRVRPGESVPVDGVVLEGQSDRRRVAADGRAGAGGEDRGRDRDRRHAQQERQLRHARRARSAPRPCWRASSPWWPRRSGAARRSRAWPTRWRPGSCRLWC